jgi:hypothetical protein
LVGWGVFELEKHLTVTDEEIFVILPRVFSGSVKVFFEWQYEGRETKFSEEWK